MNRSDAFFARALVPAVAALALLGCPGCSSLKFWNWSWGSDEPARLHHVVLIWLKLPGNPTHRKQLMEVSQSFADIPGVKSIAVGQPVASDREIVDDSFDVAIDMTFENRQALQNYLDHPDHVKAAEVSLKPLADRIVVYDFIEPYPSN